jgi:hypothetical protein
VEVGGLTEEGGTKALVGLNKNAILVRVARGGGVLAEEGYLPDKVALSALGRRGLLGLLVENADEISDDTFNLDDVEHDAVSATREGSLIVEEVVEGGLGKSGVLLVDLGDNNGVGGDGLQELGDIVLPVIGGRLGDGTEKLGGLVEREDVGVVGESEDLFVGAGLVAGGRTDVHNLAGAEVGELQLESKHVPSIGTISNLELVGVFVHLVDGEDFDDNVEILLLFLGVSKAVVLVLGDTILGAEIASDPLAEGVKEGNLVLLESGALSTVGGGREG